MADLLRLTLNGVPLEVPAGTTVAVAAMRAGVPCRISVSGAARAPLCGMGICFECRMTIDGKRHSRTCQILCESGMEVQTDD